MTRQASTGLIAEPSPHTPITATGSTGMAADPDPSDFSFEYAASLCAAIEDVTQTAVAQDPRAFEYRGIDLRYAVERDLYFTLFHDSTVQAHYAHHRRQLSAAPLADGRWAQERVGDMLCRYVFDGSRIQLVHRPRVTTTLRRLAAESTNRAAWNARSRRLIADLQTSAPNLHQARVYAVVHHEKFFRYLRPIVDAYGPDATVWVSTSAELSRELRTVGVSYVALDRWTRLHHNHLGPVLRPKASPGYGYLLAYCDALWHLFELHRPACLLLAEGNAPRDEAANRAAHRNQIPTVCVQHGWSPFVHSGFRNMSYDRMLVWGEGFATELQPYNPMQRFVATGNHVLESVDKGAVREWLRSNAQGKPAVTFFLQSALGLIGQRHWRESLELAVATAKLCPEAAIFVREHPAHPLRAPELALLTEASNVRLASATRCGLAELLAVTDVSVSIYSSTILESIALGVLPLIYNCTSMPRFNPDIDAFGAGIEVRDTEAALSCIHRLTHEPAYRESFKPSMARFRDRFFGPADSQSTARIVAEIRDVAFAGSRIPSGQPG